MDAPLRIERDEGGLRLLGRVGFADAAAATPRWRELVGEGGRVEVDAGGLRQCDSATLAVLLAWAAHASTVGVRLRYGNLPQPLRALARACGTEALLLG